MAWPSATPARLPVSHYWGKPLFPYLAGHSVEQRDWTRSKSGSPPLLPSSP